MKKLLLICIFVTVALLLCACGSDSDHVGEASTESGAPSTESLFPTHDTSESYTENPPIENQTDENTVYPPEPPTVLLFDSLSYLEAFITASTGTKEEFYEYVGSTNESATQYAINTLSYERLMEMSANIRSCNIPKLTEKITPDGVGIHYTHDYDSFEIIYTVGEERYRFMWRFDKDIAPITDRSPVAENLTLGDITVDIYELEDTGGYDNFYTVYADGEMTVSLSIHANNASDISFDIFTLEPIIPD